MNMESADQGVRHLHLSSAAFTGADRIEAFRETVVRPIMRTDVEPLDDAFTFDFTLHAMPAFAAAFGEVSPSRHTRSLATIENDDVVLNCVLQGGGAAQTRDCDARQITQGEADIVPNHAPGTWTSHVRSRVCLLRFEHARLQMLCADLDATLGRRVPCNQPALRLLTRYAGIMADDQALETPALRHAVTAHLYDLAALVIGASADAVHEAQGRGVRAARLRAIKDDIRARLTSGALSINDVAVRHRISPRYVQMLFETEDATFSAFVLEQRLALAHARLKTPALKDKKISDIAYDTGFHELSYFNRVFRRRYGMTPSEARMEDSS